jgi:hypothetical protein
MIKHLVFWKLKEKALGNDKQTNAALIKEKLEALNGRMPGMIKLEVGVDFVQGAASADVALYSEFESKEALDSYQIHPEHKLIQAFVAEVRTDRMAVDYEL